MFTGIIETIGVVTRLEPINGNLNITIQTEVSNELKIDQSIAHNGVCLTVVDIAVDEYTVTAIKETLDKSNLGNLSPGSRINLERAMKIGDRLDGHIVQGHVDQTAVCTEIIENDGSWIFSFEYIPSKNHLTIEKGSITVNGVSLTVINSTENAFSVAIIPYTYNHTNFKDLKIDDRVNLEFDVIGKYVARINQLSGSND